MADENNPSTQPPAEDSPEQKSDGQPAPKGDDGSSTPPIDTTEQARRDQQSKKDKANSSIDPKDDTMDFLLGREMEREREKYVSDFLTENKDKYPNLDAKDLRFANTPDDVKELADHLQNKYKTMQQEALSSVQATDVELTPAQLKEAEKALEKESQTTNRSTFGAWLSKKQLTRR